MAKLPKPTLLPDIFLVFSTFFQRRIPFRCQPAPVVSSIKIGTPNGIRTTYSVHFRDLVNT